MVDQPTVDTCLVSLGLAEAEQWVWTDDDGAEDEGDAEQSQLDGFVAWLIQRQTAAAEEAGAERPKAIRSCPRWKAKRSARKGRNLEPGNTEQQVLQYS